MTVHFNACFRHHHPVPPVICDEHLRNMGPHSSVLGGGEDKGKSKLSLCLTKHHTIKMY